MKSDATAARTAEAGLEPDVALATEAGPVGSGWVAACALESLTPERGVAVLIEARDQTTRQVAVFLLHSGEVMAVENRDPRSGANVIARGLIGSRDGRPTVCSPMFKDTFDLATGRCLTDDAAQPSAAEPRASQPSGSLAGEPRGHLSAGRARSVLDLGSHAVRVVGGVVMVSERVSRFSPNG